MPRKRRMTTTAAVDELLTAMYAGSEPELDKDLGVQLNWYNAVATDEDAINWLCEFLTALDRHDDVTKIRAVNREWTPRTAGWLARLALRGYNLTEHNWGVIEAQIERSLRYGLKAEPVINVSKAKPDIQRRIRDKARDVSGEIMGMIDDGIVTEDYDLIGWFRNNQVSAVVAKHLLDRYEPIASELYNVLASDDAELQAAYDPDNLAREAVTYAYVVECVKQYLGETPVTRKPRKRKAKSPAKILQHLQFAKDAVDHNLVSIAPEKILGKSELWTYNVKTKLLSVFRAADKDGLSVRRSLIVNIDEKTSMAKKIGRKTDERLQTVLTGGKVALRKLMDSINGGSTAVKRINKETILLRVV